MGEPYCSELCILKPKIHFLSVTAESMPLNWMYMYVYVSTSMCIRGVPQNVYSLFE